MWRVSVRSFHFMLDWHYVCACLGCRVEAGVPLQEIARHLPTTPHAESGVTAEESKTALVNGLYSATTFMIILATEKGRVAK